METASLSLKEFEKLKDEAAQELSDIIGFDIHLLSQHKRGERFAHLEQEYIEQNFLGYKSGQPLYFGVKNVLKGLFCSLYASNINFRRAFAKEPGYIFYKEGGEWHASNGRFDTDALTKSELFRFLPFCSAYRVQSR